LPEALRTAFPEEPRYVDLRWAQGRERLTLDDDRFRENVADLAATLHRRPKADMVGEQVRQHRHTIRLARGAIVVLSVTTVGALTAAALAVWQKRVATDQRDSARARELAARAAAALEIDPVVAVRIAAEGVRLKPLPEAEDELRAALADSRLGASAVLRGHRGPVFVATFDPTGTRVLTASDDGTARIWDAATGAILAVLHGRPGDTSIAVFDHQGTRVVTAGSPGIVSVWDAATGKRLVTLKRRRNAVFRTSFDPQAASSRPAKTEWTFGTRRTAHCSRLCLTSVGRATRPSPRTAPESSLQDRTAQCGSGMPPPGRARSSCPAAASICGAQPSTRLGRGSWLWPRTALLALACGMQLARSRRWSWAGTAGPLPPLSTPAGRAW
jgi:WD domain, G-beta repeat